MINVIGAVLATVLAGAGGWLALRRKDVLSYHRTDTVANRVGRTFIWSRHGGR